MNKRKKYSNMSLVLVLHRVTSFISLTIIIIVSRNKSKKKNETQVLKQRMGFASFFYFFFCSLYSRQTRNVVKFLIKINSGILRVHLIIITLSCYLVLTSSLNLPKTMCWRHEKNNSFSHPQSR